MKFLTFAILFPIGSATYILDEVWPKDLPASATYFSAIAIDGEFIHVSARMNTSQPILTFNDEGELLSSWGSDEISFNDELNSWGAHGLASQSGSRLWVADIQEHTTKVFTTRDRKLAGIAGTKGIAGNGIDTLQFSSTADIAIGTGAMEGEVWVSDGDGGSNHRVVRLNTKEGDANIGIHPEWVVGDGDVNIFNSPHSIAFHERSATLVVADRDNFRLQVLDAKTGIRLSQIGANCFGKEIDEFTAPWGVRIRDDYLYVAVCDSPETGSNQRILILEIDDLLNDECKVVEEIAVDPEKCLTPHELAIDGTSGDIFLACVTFADANTGASASNIQRYRKH